MTQEEEREMARNAEHICFRNEMRDLVQDAIRAERENPRLVIKTGEHTFTRLDAEDVAKIVAANRQLQDKSAPIPMILTCPMCCKRHIDEGEFATKSHHTHSCQHCGITWRPAVVATVGVQFLPGFKNKD